MPRPKRNTARVRKNVEIHPDEEQMLLTMGKDLQHESLTQTLRWIIKKQYDLHLREQGGAVICVKEGEKLTELAYF